MYFVLSDSAGNFFVSDVVHDALAEQVSPSMEHAQLFRLLIRDGEAVVEPKLPVGGDWWVVPARPVALDLPKRRRQRRELPPPDVTTEEE